MWKKLTHALHHLFNPHCAHCESLLLQERELEREHDLERRVCQSCETLKSQLEFQNQLIRELTRIEEPTPQETVSRPHQPIRRTFTPWRVKRAELEQADRKQNEALLAAKHREITADNLDEELDSVRGHDAESA